jgi:hypothetical protein
MDAQTVIKNLHPLEVKVVLGFQRGDELTVSGVERGWP